MSSLLDTLRPANPPAAKDARKVRPLDHKDDERDETLPTAVIDGEPVFQPAAPANIATTKAKTLNSKSASIRALLRDHPDGLGYDEICKGTGIARDRIGSALTPLLMAGDIKGYEIPGRGRVFKIADKAAGKVRERAPEQTPTKAAPPQPKPSQQGVDGGAAPSTAVAQSAETSRPTPATGRAAAAATPQPVAPRAVEPAVSPPLTASGQPVRATDPKPTRAQSPESARTGVDPISAAPSARASAPETAHALAVELVAVAANNLAVEVRNALKDELEVEGPLLAALRNFERADRLYVQTKGERT